MGVSKKRNFRGSVWKLFGWPFRVCEVEVKKLGSGMAFEELPKTCWGIDFWNCRLTLGKFGRKRGETGEVCGG